MTTAAHLLKAARATGVRFKFDGNDVVMEAETAPPPSLIAALRNTKSDLIALLRPLSGGWTGEDWLAFFDERAGIAEHEQGVARNVAEAFAFGVCVTEYMDRRLREMPSGQCAACGGEAAPESDLLPFGAEDAGHAWLHEECWPHWFNELRAEAEAALTCIGIGPSASKGIPLRKGPGLPVREVHLVE